MPLSEALINDKTLVPSISSERFVFWLGIVANATFGGLERRAFEPTTQANGADALGVDLLRGLYLPMNMCQFMTTIIVHVRKSKISTSQAAFT
jgi:hypothetical protein